MRRCLNVVLEHINNLLDGFLCFRVIILNHRNLSPYHQKQVEGTVSLLTQEIAPMLNRAQPVSNLCQMCYFERNQIDICIHCSGDLLGGIAIGVDIV